VDGREIALATLQREHVPEPCYTQGFITASEYYTRVTGRDYWADPEGVFVEFTRRVGANLIIQWYYPGEGQRRLECGEIMHEPHPWEGAGFRSPEDVLRHLESLPEDEAVERGYNVEAAAEGYAATVKAHQDLFGADALVIDGFGQADFMGGYNIFGYENYLAAAALYPEAMRRYYHSTALYGRLTNQAIALACEKHHLSPFVYSGQDICGANGPLMSPAMLRDLYFPELKWSMEPLIEAGIGVIWHCDGNITPILDDLMGLGVVGLQGFEEEHGADYATMCGLTDPSGRPIILLGCVSVVTTLPFGTPDDVRASVERSFTLAGPGRGHVLSTTSSTLPGTPFANVDALFEHTRTFGREFLGG
jgi:hypothetical protein